MESEVLVEKYTLGVDDATDSASPVTGLVGQSYGGLPSNSQEGTAATHSVTTSPERVFTPGEDVKRPSSLDFAEKIRRLEIEGSKLRAATVSNLSSIDYISGFNFDSSDSSYEPGKTFPPSLGSLSALVDISADQKTIHDLRVQLDSQRKETERLQKHLLSDVPSVRNLTGSGTNFNNSSHNMSSISSSSSNNLSGGSTLLPPAFSSPGKSAFSTISSSEMPPGPLFMRKSFDYPLPSHLERSLKESQEQVMSLRKRLQEATESSDLQKHQFRTTVEELKSKLHDTILNRDTVLDLRQKESSSQEMVISKLQSSLTQLQEQFRAQEEILASTKRKLDSHNHNTFIQETALCQMRTLLAEREKRRGRPYFDDPSSQQNLPVMIHSLERCFQELEHELSTKEHKVKELESDIDGLKKTSAQREKDIAKEYQELLKREAEDAVKKVSLLSTEHERNMKATTENATLAKEKASTLQAQIQENETGYLEKLRAKDDRIQELEEKVDDVRTEGMQNRALWQEKLIEAKHGQVSSERSRQALESTLDEVQRELVMMKTEKNDLIRQQAVMESKIEDLQAVVNRQDSDLEVERDKVSKQRQREEELRSQIMNLELQITNKQGDVDRLDRMLDVVKQECSAQVFDKVACVEKLERDRYLDQIKTLSAQLATMTEKFNRVSVDHHTARSEMESLHTQVHDLTDKMEKARCQVECALTEKNELTSMLGDKRGDIDRLARDKDHFLNLAEQRADELTELKITVDRLKIQLDEKEKILNTFRQQSSSINQLMEVNTKASDNIREERERLASALDDKTALLEEMKVTSETLNRKLRSRDKRVRELEEERLKVAEELVLKSQELDVLQQEKESVVGELKESRKDVATITASKDALKKELTRLKLIRTKEINKLQGKLKESEQNHRLTQKAMRSKDMVDHKAVKFADKIQKEMTVKRSEMDLMMSRVHHLEEKLETITKEKVMVEKDKDSLKKSLAKSLLHTQELTDELETTQAQNQELVRRVADLEDQLEKATIKSSASHAQLEKYEQEITTLRLKHQLDLKEAEYQGSNKVGSNMVACGSSIPTSASINSHMSSNYNGKADKGGESSSSAVVSDFCESDVPYTKNTLELRDGRHRDYAAVGKDLKMLLSEMRGLVSGHRESQNDLDALGPPDGQREPRRERAKAVKDSKVLGSAPLSVHDLGAPGKSSDRESQSETERSWASKSLSGLADLSDFSSYKEWRPRSHSLSKHQRSLSSDLDLEQGSSFVSKGGLADVSRLSQSTGSPRKPATRPGAIVPLVPDTQELCRRLEEKIDSLTRMGGNLQKENKEMAELINLQGEKLVTVKKIEKDARELR